MTAEKNPGQARTASGTEASTTARRGTEAPSDVRPNGPGPSLQLPGMPFPVDPKRVLWWGGLAALATVGVLEWPVAAVVGAGSYVAERWARDDTRRADQQRP